MNTEAAEAERLLGLLDGKECWYASYGGMDMPQFSLAFGGKVLRDVALRNLSHSEDFRLHEGEANLYVWCTWRIDDPHGPISSSDDTDEHIAAALESVVGHRVAKVIVSRPAWDLAVEFSNNRVLHVFCDHVPGDPSFDGNWELTLREFELSIGVGSICVVRERKGDIRDITD